MKPKAKYIWIVAVGYAAIFLSLAGISKLEADSASKSLLAESESDLLLSIAPYEKLLHSTTWIMQKYQLQIDSSSRRELLKEAEGSFLNISFGMDYEYFMLRTYNKETIIKLFRHGSVDNSGEVKIAGESDFHTITSGTLLRPCYVNGELLFCIIDIRNAGQIKTDQPNYSLVALGINVLISNAKFRNLPNYFLLPNPSLNLQIDKKLFPITRSHNSTPVFSHSQQIDTDIALTSHFPLAGWMYRLLLLSAIFALVLITICVLSFIFFKQLVIKKTEQRYLHDRNEFLGRVEVELNSVIHDVRSPMAALNMMIEDENDQRRRGMLVHIAKRLRGIIDDLEIKGTEVRSKQSQSLMPVVQLLRLLVHEKNREVNQFRCELIVEGNDSDYWCQGHVFDFCRMFSNLLNNALEASKDDNKVKIRLSRSKNDSCLISIADRGCGISQDLIPHIFEKGFTKKEAGTGIGLFHAKNIVERMSGSLTVSSEVNVGSEFVVSLPLAQKPSWHLESIHISKFKQVVIVEDDVYFREYWRDRLLPYDIQVMLFDSPAKIPQHLWHDPSALFILDNMFANEMLGIEMIRKLLGRNCLLITSTWHEVEVQKTVEILGAKLHSKQFIDEVKLVV